MAGRLEAFFDSRSVKAESPSPSPLRLARFPASPGDAAPRRYFEPGELASSARASVVSSSGSEDSAYGSTSVAASASPRHSATLGIASWEPGAAARASSALRIPPDGLPPLTAERGSQEVGLTLADEDASPPEAEIERVCSDIWSQLQEFCSFAAAPNPAARRHERLPSSYLLFTFHRLF